MISVVLKELLFYVLVLDQYSSSTVSQIWELESVSGRRKRYRNISSNMLRLTKAFNQVSSRQWIEFAQCFICPVIKYNPTNSSLLLTEKVQYILVTCVIVQVSM